MPWETITYYQSIQHHILLQWDQNPYWASDYLDWIDRGAYTASCRRL